MVQRSPSETMEYRTVQGASGDRTRDHRLPLPVGDLEVERERAQDAQLHLDELARSATGLLPDHHRADLSDHRRQGTHHPRGGGPQPLRDPLKGSDAEFTTVPLTRHEFHGGWK